MESYETRAELAARLAACGIRDEIAESILRETGRYRHAGRVRAALQAAQGAVCRMYSAITEEAAHLYRRPILAAFLCILDEFGPGGIEGVTGDATTRVPYFSRLGKGRKHASDGLAWTAAIRSAASDIRYPNGIMRSEMTSCPMGGYLLSPQWLVIEPGAEPATLNLRPTGSSEAWTPFEIPMEPLHHDGLREWTYSLAREAVRLKLGFPSLVLPDWKSALVFAGELAEWARLLNDVRHPFEDGRLEHRRAEVIGYEERSREAGVVDPFPVKRIDGWFGEPPIETAESSVVGGVQ